MALAARRARKGEFRVMVLSAPLERGKLSRAWPPVLVMAACPRRAGEYRFFRGNGRKWDLTMAVVAKGITDKPCDKYTVGTEDLRVRMLVIGVIRPR